MDLRLTRPRSSAAGCAGRGARGVLTCGGCRRVQRAAAPSIAGRGVRGARRAGRGGAGPGAQRRGPARASPPRGRVRAVVACAALGRAGVSPRVPGGGGEPRAARPRADAARSRSAPCVRPPRRAPRAAPPPAGRRARSLAARSRRAAHPALHVPRAASHPAPRLRPVFLWARQRDGTVQEVRCEDYDPRNRIRIARTPDGWRVIPRTEIYNSIRVPPPPPARSPPRERNERRARRRRSGESKRARESVSAAPPARPAWLAPDLESHIPSHTIAVPRALPRRSPTPRSPTPSHTPSPACSPTPARSPTSTRPPSLARSPTPPAEPTPLDNLLAVAELEFHQQQRGKEGRALDLEELDAGAPYAFLPEEQVAREVMSFDLGEPPKASDELFFERKSHASADRAADDDAFASSMVVHKDLFETISEAHYLPDLGGPHDEALLESLVEKGCEDNQILGQALDKLAHLVHGAGDYAEEEDDMLLGGAPVADIIDRLEQSLESPGRSSITAAQGLLHLHHIGDHLPPQDIQHNVERQTYIEDEVFAAETAVECAMNALNSVAEHQDNSMVSRTVERMEYDGRDADKRLDVNASAMYTESVPETNLTCQNQTIEEHQTQYAPDQSEMTTPCDIVNRNVSAEMCDRVDNKSDSDNTTLCGVNDQDAIATEMMSLDFGKEIEESSTSEESGPTDLSIKHIETNIPHNIAEVGIAETLNNNNNMEDNLSEKSDEQPKDLSVHRHRLPTPHASPRRLEIPRAPSRESDAMQSPQPSGIPAIPSSPEIFTMPPTKSKQTLFLETLLSSPSPKMYTSEVTITKQQCEPLNLGKHRKSASPTVTSCSDEIKKFNKEFGEPQEKKIKRESADDLAKISKVFNKTSDDSMDLKQKKSERSLHKSCNETNPLKQLQILKMSPDFNIPDPLLVPKDKLNDILAAPAREIPALLVQRPELRLPEAFAFPAVLQDPNILVISLAQLEVIIENDAKKNEPQTPKETKTNVTKSSVNTEKSNTPQPDQTGQPKPIPSMDALAGDIDAATSAALNQMLWLPYLSQLEAMAACSQNMDFLKALNSSVYNGQNYPDLSQMFNHSSRFMGPAAFPMMPPMDYDSRLQFAMWQEAMSHANASGSHRPKPSSLEAQMKELSSKSSDVQNPYVHSTKSHQSHQSKAHSSARTSPIAYNYNNQRSMNHHPFLQGMYPGMNPNMRPNMPLPGLQIPYFNPNMMSQRSPRASQQKSPTSPYYPNNNYLQSVKQSEAHQRSSSTSSQESPRPRISVKSLQNLLEPTAVSGVGSSRRGSHPPATVGRRREEPEVGSTTPLGEPPPHLPPHPHDPSSFHLWHPLFGNQKGYNSPWSWTTVTATGD